MSQRGCGNSLSRWEVPVHGGTCAMPLRCRNGTLGKRVAPLSSARMNEVRAALRFSLGCNSN